RRVGTEGRLGLTNRVVIEATGHAERLNHTGRVLLDVAGIGNTPGSEVLFRGATAHVNLGVTLVYAEVEAAVVELDAVAKIELVHFHLLPLRRAARNLGAEVLHVENAVAVAFDGVIDRVTLDREPVSIAPIKGVLGDYGRRKSHECCRMTDRVVRNRPRFVEVGVEAQRSILG